MISDSTCLFSCRPAASQFCKEAYICDTTQLRHRLQRLTCSMSDCSVATEEAWLRGEEQGSCSFSCYISLRWLQNEHPVACARGRLGAVGGWISGATSWRPRWGVVAGRAAPRCTYWRSAAVFPSSVGRLVQRESENKDEGVEALPCVSLFADALCAPLFFQLSPWKWNRWVRSLITAEGTFRAHQRFYSYVWSVRRFSGAELMKGFLWTSAAGGETNKGQDT